MMKFDIALEGNYIAFLKKIRKVRNQKAYHMQFLIQHGEKFQLITTVFQRRLYSKHPVYQLLKAEKFDQWDIIDFEWQTLVGKYYKISVKRHDNKKGSFNTVIHLERIKNSKSIQRAFHAVQGRNRV